MTDTRLNFKDMCAKFDVTPRTLRYYEYIELLQPEREGRSRFYSAREIARMTLIMRGRRWGFPLEDIRQFLLVYEEHGTKAQLQHWIDMADGKLIELEKQRAELNTAIEELTENRRETLETLQTKK
ncbi:MULTISPECIES: MerR family DNA-binding transcriptional regulator [Lentibacter]|jgi:DNA-binding transcriptional MerR regulator|uniref:Transcriptional regulator, MerR family n=1 Tax=Lentibacter algarum TaxID=576131 RepID=A0A1H3H6G7_9RHOB|nr:MULTISPECIES: MerR family DNA-binding transcriptional regulator [Lentibacter]MCH9825834.1 MerR family DNA-binding transcriptional regulator [Alphaproteobacteria bacterium]MCO4778249.1 MerR family DNA-binding transcriptional regulator [Lentibacter algarum]MCO4828429.1 MerR family DNA-binding transcriptional regulator [Lentibacter algarum]MDG1289348.1 MerR family DNA-binding transcriptional regulator [Lentibacter sp.]SDY10815.1 transcriptional regulator, MerR family [Lentibacter algarum]